MKETSQTAAKEPSALNTGAPRKGSTKERVLLGTTAVKISPLGIGTWSWGDSMIWGYGRTYHEKDLKEAFNVCLQEGINFFDTAEAYGWGQAEQLLGQFIHTTQTRVVVATKFLPSPWRLRKSSLLHAVRSSLTRLDIDAVDLYQFHKHYPPVPFKTWMEALVESVEKGFTRAVGVSNCDKSFMEIAVDVLGEYGIRLTSNQIEYSLLHREPEHTHLLNMCRSKKITVLAYSPLAMGLLTGKYTPDNPPVEKFTFRERLALQAYSLFLPDSSAAKACQFGRNQIAQIGPVIDALGEIGECHSKTPTQVALNWVISKGAVPLVGVKNAQQARENAGALHWRLSKNDVATLDEACESA